MSSTRTRWVLQPHLTHSRVRRSCLTLAAAYRLVFHLSVLSDYRHVPPSPGMWKEPNAGADRLVGFLLSSFCSFPTAATCHVCQKCHRPGLKIKLNRFQMSLKGTWFVSARDRPVFVIIITCRQFSIEYLKGVQQPSAQVCQWPSSHFNPSISFSDGGLCCVSHSCLPLHGLTC